MEKQASLVFHRQAGLHFSKRWTSGQYPTIPDDDWSSSINTRVKVDLDVCSLKDRPGDVNSRPYLDSTGTSQSHPLPQYAVVDLEHCSDQFQHHICSAWEEWARQQGVAFEEAFRLIRSKDPAAETLENLTKYAYAAAELKTGSAYLVGSATLGISRVPADARTQAGRIPLPRVADQQADMILSKLLDVDLRDLFGKEGSMPKLLNSDARGIHAYYVGMGILVDVGVQIYEDMIRRAVENAVGAPVILTPEELQTIQESLNTAVNSLRGSVRGRNHLLQELSPEAKAYHKATEEQPLPGDVDCKNAWTWLPPLKELCAKRPRQNVEFKLTGF